MPQLLPTFISIKLLDKHTENVYNVTLTVIILVLKLVLLPTVKDVVLLINSSQLDKLLELVPYVIIHVPHVLFTPLLTNV